MSFTTNELSVIWAEELAGRRVIGFCTNDEQSPPPHYPPWWFGRKWQFYQVWSQQVWSYWEVWKRDFFGMYLIHCLKHTLFTAHNMISHFVMNWLQVRQQSSTLEAKIHDKFSAMKIFIEESFKMFMPETRTQQNADPKSDNSGLTKVSVNYYSIMFILCLHIFFYRFA